MLAFRFPFLLILLLWLFRILDKTLLSSSSSSAAALLLLLLLLSSVPTCHQAWAIS